MMTPQNYWQRLNEVQEAINRLSSTMVALRTTNPERYAGNLEALSLDAAYQAEALACQMRHIIFRSNSIPRQEYLVNASAHADIRLNVSEDIVSVNLPMLIPNRKKSASREYISGMVYAVLANAQRQFTLPHFEKATLCIVHCFENAREQHPIPDYDNLELKTVQDVLALYTMVDDSMRYCNRFETMREDIHSHTEFHVVRQERFSEWYEAYQNSKNQAKTRVENAAI